MPEQAALDQWYCIDNLGAVPEEQSSNRLLGTDLQVTRDGDAIGVSAQGRPRPVCHRYGYVWTTLGTPAGDVFDMPEADEPDPLRRMRRHRREGRRAPRGRELPRHGTFPLRSNR